MKTAFIALAILLPAQSFAQTVNLGQLRDRCVPTASLATLSAIVHAESSGNPIALQLDFPNRLLRQWQLPPGALRLMRQPSNVKEALEWIDYLNAWHVSVDVGLMQVSTEEAMRRHIPTAALLDPCTNIRTGWAILSDDYELEVRTYGPGQAALQHALSRFNTGDTNRGIDDGYLARVMAALKQLSHLPNPTRSSRAQHPGGQK
ncbi:transglycosylase SLT domain-containing protein [Occallatibacter riparius]|uniref:Transglycosylase SLT domain-containing protein n=1 Tax=Occallatibacter riparius TaxID=1002689 RepID=A0A9J7BW47_9BACT|nr:transglycosylase SLT domain-containing protein [Occallatibacter riparius]UWZ85110.1 transglycosylase SLT domain-containing protein [Occallatibacter riparius]